MRGASCGLVGDMLVGILGALIGGWLSTSLLGIPVTGLNVTSIVIAFIGAVILIAITRAVARRRSLI